MISTMTPTRGIRIASSHTCQMDYLVIFHSGLWKPSKLQAALSFQVVGIRFVAKSSNAIFDKFIRIVQRDSLVDVHLCGVSRLDSWSVKRDESDFALG